MDPHHTARLLALGRMVIGAVLLVATNVFVREDDRWRMVHHHASALPDPFGVPVMPAPSNDIN